MLGGKERSKTGGVVAPKETEEEDGNYVPTLRDNLSVPKRRNITILRFVKSQKGTDLAYIFLFK